VNIPRAPHRWSVSPARAVEIQRELADVVRESPLRGAVRLVAGADLAFGRDGRQCVAAVVVWDVERRTVIEERVAVRDVRFPYVPGLLSFREAPAILDALRKVRSAPDVLMCDGHGRAHPRRFGIACHLGVLTGLPTLGCAKSRLIGEHPEPGSRRGQAAPLVHRGEVVGRVLRTRDGVRPVYVSIGHALDLVSAERLTLTCAVAYRLPEPTRRADLLVARARLAI